MGEPRRPAKPKGRPPPTASAGEVMGVGLQFAASILLFFFVGRWLDERLGTEPWLLLIGVFVGGGAGFYSLYRRLVTDPRQREEQRMREADQTREQR